MGYAMRMFLLAFVVVATSLLASSALVPCLGAALAQESRTPPGHWCQRYAVRMDRRAHACGCHKADCQHPDAVPPAHDDRQCLNFCAVASCRCPMIDCE